MIHTERARNQLTKWDRCPRSNHPIPPFFVPKYRIRVEPCVAGVLLIATGEGDGVTFPSP